MECSLVPKAGYRLETLDPRSFRRGFGPKAIWHNLTGAYHTARSLGKARRLIRSFLHYVPYVTLAVMTFPAILSATGSWISGLLALLVGLVLSWLGAGLFPVALSCCGAVLLSEFLMNILA